jgi:hypothetical protein
MVPKCAKNDVDHFSVARICKGGVLAAQMAGSSNGVFQPAIFRDIAQEALSFCRESLELASQRIAAKQTLHGSIDSKLFLIRHLLVLKDLVHDINLTKSDGEVQSTQPSRFPCHQATTHLMICQAPQTVSLEYPSSGLLPFLEVWLILVYLASLVAQRLPWFVDKTWG